MTIARGSALAFIAVVLLVIAGILLHVLWPVQLLSISIGLDLGLVIVGLAVAATIGVLISLMWRRLRD